MPRNTRYTTSGNHRSRATIEATQDRALQLRETTNLTLREIAVECGYTHPITGEPRPQSADMAIRAAQRRRSVGLGLPTAPTNTNRPTRRANGERATRSRNFVSNRTFGVEVEFTGINYRQAVDALNAAGVPASFEGYSHTTMNTWKVVTDSTCGYELVSPVLSGEDGLAQVKKAVDAIRTAGARVNTNCGLHVHVGMAGVTGTQMMQVFDLYMSNQDNISNLLSRSRRNNRWCKPLTNAYNATATIARVRTMRTVTATRNARRDFGNVDRYQALNISAYARHGTIEFRQHQGTLNVRKIQAWIEFVLAVVERGVTDGVTTGSANTAEFVDSLNIKQSTKTYLKNREVSLASR